MSGVYRKKKERGARPDLKRPYRGRARAEDIFRKKKAKSNNQKSNRIYLGARVGGVNGAEASLDAPAKYTKIGAF